MRSRSMCGAAVVAAVLASPTVAQQSGHATTSTDPAAGPGFAAEVEEIIVTGERADRSLRDTASSVSVTTGSDIARIAGADDLNDILALTPNVSLGNGDSGASIRGQDSTGVLGGVFAFFGGGRPRATLSVDGRALSYNEYIYGLASVWDVAQVEVFRGPQTTTQGRNSIGGAIFIRTADPTYKLEGAAQVQIADQSSEQFSAGLSVPIVADQVALRLSFDTRDADTWVRKPNATHAITGDDPLSDDFLVARAKLLVEPASLPGVRALLTYTHADSTTQQAEAIDPPFRNRTDNGVSGALFDTRSDTGIVDVTFDLGNSFELGTRVTYADLTIDRLAPVGQGPLTIDTEEVTVEAIGRFQPADGNLSGLAGFYFVNSDQDEASDLSAFLGRGDFRDQQESLGIFGEATIKLGDRLSLTGGARYQRDTQDRTGSLGPFAVDYHRTFEALLPKAAVAFDVSETLRIGATAARGYNPGGTTISFTSGLEDEFREEKLWNYEVYARLTSPDRRFSLQANVFYTDYEDAQRITTIVLPGNVFDSAFDNAEDARAYGAEVEASFRASPDLNFRAGLGLLHTDLRRFTVSADPVEGNAFARAPGVNGFASVGWAPTKGAMKGLSLDLQARYSDGFFSDDLNDPALKVGDSFVADVQVGYTFGRVKVFAFARNLFDEFYLTNLYSTTLATAGEPQRLGGGVRVRF